MLFDLFISFFYINVIAYFLLLLWFIIGLLKIKSLPSKTPLNIIKDISIIVCVKNEEKILNNIAEMIVSAAFWSVMLVGIVDAAISFVRIEDFLPLIVGDDLA